MGDLDQTDDSLLTVSGLSDVEKAEVCAEIAKGRGVAHALARLGRYMDDLDVALAADQTFQREYEMALALRDDEVEQALHKKARKGNVTAQKFWLTNRRPDRWVEARTTRHVGHNGGAIEVATTIAALRDVFTSEETRNAAVEWAGDDIIDVDPLPEGELSTGEGEVTGEAG
jgi:hypothetical protein